MILSHPPMGWVALCRAAGRPKRRWRIGYWALPLMAEGGAVLKIGVTAAPEDGKANARLVALLAKQFRVAKSDIALIQV